MTRSLPILVLLAIAAPPAAAQEAIYLVRHAERIDQSADSPLSPAGEARAARLAKAVSDAGITHIFTTDLRRTIRTAAPIADAVHLTPRALPSSDVGALVSALRALTPTDRALVVGHSNTVPSIISALGAGTVRIGDDEHDWLFVVVPRKDETPALLRFHY